MHPSLILQMHFAEECGIISMEYIRTCGGDEAMKLLYGTSNPAKLETMRKMLTGLDIELLCLSDMEGEIPEVSETGDTPMENAIQKATAYYKVFEMPVFSCDSGLYFNNLPEYSPKVHVRHVNGVYLDDDQMIAYYGGLAAKYGDIMAQYRNAICLVTDEEHMYTDDNPELGGLPFVITSVPHSRREKGFPLDSLSKWPEGGYCYDTEARSPGNMKEAVRRFFRETLGV